MSIRPVATWLVPLEGHAFDLEDLPVYMHGHSVQVVLRDSIYNLAIPVNVGGVSHERVREVALAFVELVNGAASLLISSYSPISVTSGAFFGVDDSGSVVNTVVPVGTAEMRCKAGHMNVLIDGVPQPDSRQGRIASLVELAKRSTAGRDALSLVGRPSPTWSELYLVYELVKANAGSRMFSDNWISRSQAELFRRTANSYTALGRAARHGKEATDSPKNPMPQREATQLMRELVRGWLLNHQAGAAGAG